MCKDCGCSGHHHEHSHHHHDHSHGTGHEHTHTRPDGSTYTHTHDIDVTREVAIGNAILAANDTLAENNRKYFADRNIIAYNLISSPGSGKTTLLVKVLEKLAGNGVKTAVIVGDQYGDIDAERMRAANCPVTQIETHSSCHLDAARVHAVLEEAIPEDIRILFIENVGNLVCPVAFDLGERAKIALFSTTEGEEKPLKYPALFAAAELVLLTKCDLEPVLDWNYELAVKNIKQVNPDAKIMRISAKTGEGLDNFTEFIKSQIK